LKKAYPAGEYLLDHQNYALLKAVDKIISYKQLQKGLVYLSISIIIFDKFNRLRFNVRGCFQVKSDDEMMPADLMTCEATVDTLVKLDPSSLATLLGVTSDDGCNGHTKRDEEGHVPCPCLTCHQITIVVKKDEEDQEKCEGFDLLANDEAAMAQVSSILDTFQDACSDSSQDQFNDEKRIYQMENTDEIIANDMVQNQQRSGSVMETTDVESSQEGGSQVRKLEPRLILDGKLNVTMISLIV